MPNGILPEDPGMNVGDNRARMPDASQIPELQAPENVPDIGDPLADALKTIAEWVVAQEEKGNPGPKAALGTFMTEAFGAPAEAAQPTEEMAEGEEAPIVPPEEGEETEEPMPEGMEDMNFNPLVAPPEEEEEEETEEERERKKLRSKDRTQVL